ncbi:MAG: RimJ/RimL family protein N-acetyltransferase [Myxococcota bacterium]|jgi:RimJ/RimL family protein N-acetyltransferase
MTIRLEPLSLDHLDGVMTWVNDPEVTFYFARIGEPITRAAERTYLEGLLASTTDRVWSIFDDDAYLGQIGLSNLYWPARNGRLGVMLARHAWGRGVAKQAAKLLLTEAFGALNLHKVWLIVRSDNAKGLGLWTGVGFRCEGILRDEYHVHDRFYDMVRLAMVRSDWDAGPG